jgi:phosphoribosylanthranilate isomerase
MMRVKICGITRVEDAMAAAAAGADAIGLVFVARSARNVDLQQAAEICRSLPPFVSRVGLFMDSDVEFVRQAMASVPLNWLQFHGQETPEFCRQFQRPWIKAIAMASPGDAVAAGFEQADALLLDAHGAGELGGSGKTFDWDQVPRLDRPWILAGGLRPDNVALACRQLRPHAVDVSSGVETRPGIKDGKLMSEFIKAARHG